MKLVCIAAVLSLAVLAVAGRKNWALLIAGSNTWDNYRHQSDICHAYQILHKNGIPDEQIVVMMYDDIAHNRRNPFPGNIINRYGGPNVYPGVPKDYTGKDVNPDTFLAALQGNKDDILRLTGKSGKVIESGPDDHIFVYFADHGAPGLLGMPSGSPPLKARSVNQALKKMHSENKFAQLTFYIEACESGSIFKDQLPNNINIYATTAANAHESSWAFYWDKVRETYLGDLYSVKWMEDTDNHNVHNETLETQYERVKKETYKSHVQQFGELSLDKEFLSDFFSGPNPTGPHDYYQTPFGAPDAVPSEMVPMTILKKRIEAAPQHSSLKYELEQKLVDLQTRLIYTHSLFREIADQLDYNLYDNKEEYKFMVPHEDIKNWDCYEISVDHLHGICPGLDLFQNDFGLRRFFVLVNLCNHHPMRKVLPAINAAVSVNTAC